jgi:hypothetical protein
MSSWFWLNIPACVAVFSATVGIPLWLVFKQPGVQRHAARHRAAAAPQSAKAQAHQRDLQLTR